MADWMADGQSEYLWLTEWLAVWCMASYLHQGLKLKKFQVAFWQLSKTKRSPNAKMQLPDSTRTEPQISAWHLIGIVVQNFVQKLFVVT